MILDAHSLVSLLTLEAEPILNAVVSARRRAVSAASLLEAGMQLQAERGEEALRDLDLLVTKLKLAVLPLGEEQAEAARRAFVQFGNQANPPLSLGDCAAYALARESGEPLMLRGAQIRVKSSRSA